MLKKCFKCGTDKDISLFYTHPQMADGHLGKCKDCTKNDVEKRYYSDDGIKKIIAYEKHRFKTPERKFLISIYQSKRRKRYPEKERARNLTHKAIKTGKIIKGPCKICGSVKSEAHHEDYRDWENIKWLCRKHHLSAHGKRYLVN
jgi:hypothetical protein